MSLQVHLSLVAVCAPVECLELHAVGAIYRRVPDPVLPAIEIIFVGPVSAADHHDVSLIKVSEINFILYGLMCNVQHFHLVLKDNFIFFYYNCSSKDEDRRLINI